MAKRKRNIPIQIGQRFGQWTVVQSAGMYRTIQRWLCHCDCGTESVVLANNLHNGMTLSCRKRGRHISPDVKSNHPEYCLYIGMRRRCLSTTDISYPRYGGRGITICDHWLASFENFFADMGPRPDPTYSLDRIDNNGPYSPDNCRWATVEEQSNNKSNSRYYDYNGKRQTLAQWAREYGLHAQTLKLRLNTGWPFIDAISLPPHKGVSRFHVSRSRPTDSTPS